MSHSSIKSLYYIEMQKCDCIKLIQFIFSVEMCFISHIIHLIWSHLMHHIQYNQYFSQTLFRNQDQIQTNIQLHPQKLMFDHISLMLKSFNNFTLYVILVTFSVKDQIVNILGSVDHAVSVTMM